jgi:hypothetical protein
MSVLRTTGRLALLGATVASGGDDEENGAK